MKKFRSKVFPWIAQRDAMQCGVSCISMICRYYGHPYSLGLIEELCAPQARGVSLSGMSDAASKLGFETLCVRTSLTKLSDVNLPVILHWNKNHFVVLYKVNLKKEKFYISDPAKGKCVLNKREFCKHWISTATNDDEKGIAMILEPNDDFGKFPDSFSVREIRHRNWKFIIRYIKDYKKYFYRIFITLYIASILQLILPFLTQGIVDIGIRDSNIKIIWLILLGECMIVAGRTISDFVRSKLTLNISMKVNISMVSDFIIKLLGLPMRFLTPET